MMRKEIDQKAVSRKELADDDWVQIAYDLGPFVRGLLKAIPIAATAYVAALAFSGGEKRAIGIAALTFTLAAFRTWRRFLEPVCLFVFLLTVLYLCIGNSAIGALLKTAAR